MVRRRGAEADALGKGQGLHGKPNDEDGTVAVSSFHRGDGVTRSRDTGDSDTAGGFVPDRVGGMRSRSSSLENTDPESTPEAAAAGAATASSPPGFCKGNGSGGMGAAGVKRGMRAGGGGREVIRGAAGARAGGAKRDEVEAASMATATCEVCAKSDASVDQELFKGFGVSVCRSCKVGEPLPTSPAASSLFPCSVLSSVGCSR